MKTKKEQRVLTAIQDDLLRELLKEKCTLLETMRVTVQRQDFSARKYKDQESYERLLNFKRAYNILKTFLEVCAHEEIDCS